MTSTNPVRWAVAGFGSGGRIFHAPLVDAAPSMQLVAVVTSNSERRRLVRQSYPDASVVANLAELAAMGVQGVTISTPSGTHAALAATALDLGLAVVVDKPFALDEASAAGLVELALLRRGVLIPFQNRRWDSDFRTIEKLIDQGVLGRVFRFASRIDRFRPITSGWSATGSAAEGGGALHDLGPHLVDQALQLFGPVATVYAELSTFRSGSGADDDFQLSLRHVGGVLSTLSAGKASAAQGPRFLVNGSTSGFVIDGFDVQESQLKAGYSPRDLGETWGVEPPSAYGRLVRTDGTTIVVPSERGRWDSFYPAVAATVRDQAPAPVQGAEAILTARVLDAARQSALSGSVVKVQQ
ncbi:gfo/Idh/MocA family oxidoreductase [Nakamurella antarctica]|uniref:Gfo/Idh/MocA family oxidoreductase n=1 Tax=Nakamurella antarctica TaxID=1902245 RepID=A0A3G8ZQC6_9ACTN|nr:gfo/Idh/MocA family oxidoreductase [Nakamurella antarctica]